MSIRPSLIGRVVAASTRHPLIVLLLAVVLTGAALLYTAQHFALNANTTELISTKLKWRQQELAFEAAFPQFNNLTMVVVDGATPELADAAARQLAAALQEKPELFHSVRRPDGGPFFDRNGLLLLPTGGSRGNHEGAHAGAAPPWPARRRSQPAGRPDRHLQHAGRDQARARPRSMTLNPR